MSVPYALNVSKNINDLSDGKSEFNNNPFLNGSSLFIGVDAGLNDDGADNEMLV